MNFFKFLLLVAGVYAAYTWWSKTDLEPRGTSQQPTSTSGSLSAEPSPNGFRPTLIPASGGADRVVIVAPVNCSSKACKTGDSLANALRNQGVKVVRTQNLSFGKITNAEEMRLAQSAASSSLPIVFVGNRVKGNPTLAEVLAEYRQ